MSMEKLVMMVPTLLKPSSIAVEFGQAQATRRHLTRWGAPPGTVLFKVEDKMKAGEMLAHCQTFPILSVDSTCKYRQLCGISH
jgi:hypothetical protein